MLNSLLIKNYRNLKELKINSLSRVNLITGKNNTGKSSILEAVLLYVSEGRAIQSILRFRNNMIDQAVEQVNSYFLSLVPSSFHLEEDKISVGDIDHANFITLQKSSVTDEITRNGEPIQRKKADVVKISLLKEANKLEERYYGIELFGPYFLEISRFIRPWGGSGNDDNLWDTVTLTEKEKYVINALKIIDTGIEQLSFIQTDSRGLRPIREPFVKLLSIDQRIPLKTMGDGINRILSIILAMVNADNGCLLIDEFENGLHYSVQKQLWEIIFKLSKELNVQVFATTHSNDCISSFQEVLNNLDYSMAGQMIRLDNVNGEVKPTIFNAEELKMADERSIEIR